MLFLLSINKSNDFKRLLPGRKILLSITLHKIVPDDSFLLSDKNVTFINLCIQLSLYIF